ncbi:MAG: hypothetical protein Q9227_008882 [Pyrenula ochraceoflavens]
MAAEKLELKIDGTSTIHRRAERAVLTVDVSAIGSSRESVSEEVIAASNRLQDMLRPHNPQTSEGIAAPDAAITHWAMNTLRTYHYDRTDRDNKPLAREYHCSTKINIKFQDFKLLGEIATALASMPNVDVPNISWRVTDATREALGSQARKEAVQDAVTKARDFASVVSDKEPKAVLIEERHSSQTTSSHMRRLKGQRMQAATGEGESNGLSFEPEDVQLSTNVHVKFVVD